MEHNSIITALKNLAPQAEWTLNGDNYDDLIWLSEGTKPTKAAIQKEIDDLPAKANSSIAAKAELLNKLGITAEEAALLLS
jgi:hypothetical protein